ncbi:hypothetical protein [Maribacter luteus]|uniref:hypothetical protein n=1 Tax=Maribacter luteus TaxID=2594478 RepID=UPI002490A2E7|nr:hypothetical protein [Maribacter luteus]
MEFSFEYSDLLKVMNNNLAVIQSLAYIGILLLYIPYRFLISLFKQAPDGKLNIIGLLYFGTTWFMGAIIVGIMQYTEQSVLKMYLVWIIIVLINLMFVLNNNSLLYKVYQRKIKEILKKE